MEADKKILAVPIIIVFTFIAVFLVMAALNVHLKRIDPTMPGAMEIARTAVDDATVALSIIVMLSLVSVLIIAYIVFWALQDEHRAAERAKTQFFGMITHELRSPLTPIQAELQMLLQGYNGKITPKQKASLGIILRNSTRLDNLIGDLIDATKLQSSQLKMVFVDTDLSKELAGVMADTRHVLPEKRIVVSLDIRGSPRVHADPGRVMQVMRNLLHNAKKYAPEGSTVELHVERVGDVVRFVVRDHGPGIKKELQARVFEPFFQGSPDVSTRYGGTGLGLVVCRGIVEAHGGKMWFESEEGNGTAFYFTIPAKTVLKHGA